MMRLALFLMGLFLMPAVLAQKTVQSPADFPHYKETQEIRDQRIEILISERTRTEALLKTAVAALPKASDQTEAAADVRRLQQDLAAINREITRVNSQHDSSAVTAQKPSVSTGGDIAVGTGKAEAVKTSEANFAPWDVFKNFGK